jgi:hypothetical protein
MDPCHLIHSRKAQVKLGGREIHPEMNWLSAPWIEIIIKPSCPQTALQ